MKHVLLRTCTLHKCETTILFYIHCSDITQSISMSLSRSIRCNDSPFEKHTSLWKCDSAQWGAFRLSVYRFGCRNNLADGHTEIPDHMDIPRCVIEELKRCLFKFFSVGSWNSVVSRLLETESAYLQPTCDFLTACTSTVQAPCSKKCLTSSQSIFYAGYFVHEWLYGIIFIQATTKLTSSQH